MGTKVVLYGLVSYFKMIKKNLVMINKFLCSAQILSVVNVHESFCYTCLKTISEEI